MSRTNALQGFPVGEVRGEAADLATLAARASAGSVRFRLPTGADATRARTAATDAVAVGVARMDARRTERDHLVATVGDAPRQPWIYLIVATGDIYEDIPQAQQAAREGADRRAIGQALARAEGNISGASRLLGISRPTLYDLIKTYGLHV